MADNTPISPAQPGGDVIATDEVTSLNGAPSSGVKVQRAKLGWGSDGAYVDASAANPVPVSLGGPQTVTGPLTNAELRAAPVPVTGTFWQVTQPVSLASLPPLPAGSNAIGSVAVSNFPSTQTVAGSVSVSNFPASQTVRGAVSVSNFPATQAVSVAALPLPDGASQDRTTAAAPFSVRLSDGASFLSALPVSQSGTWNIGSIASLPALPAGANTIGAVNVVGTVPISAASLPLPSGAATDAGQATGNASLANIDGDLGAQADAAASSDTGAFSLIALVKRALQNWTTLLSRTPLLGQAAMAASQPVVIASDQSPVPTAPTPATASGTITTQNLVPNGAATANSAVEIVLNGATSVAIQTTGGYTGALSLQVTLDGSRWETVTGAIITNMLTGVAAATIASAAVGVFTAPVHGALRARVTGLAAMTGTAAITLRTIAAPTALYALQPTAANLNATVAGTVTANIGTGALAAGTNAIGDVGLQVRANATGAATAHHFVSAATTNVAQIKATAGRVVGWHLANTTASWRYVKLHNVASATAGAAVAVTIGIPPNGVASVNLPAGIAFATAISRSAVTGAADADTTATGVNDIVGDIFFA